MKVDQIFSYFPGEWRNIVQDTIERARLIGNPAYDLPEAWHLEIPKKENPVCDDAIVSEPAEQLYKINEKLTELSQGQSQKDTLFGCKLASYEVFLEKYETKMENSQGLELKTPSTKIIWDFVLISPNNEVEVNNLLRRRFLSHLNWEEILQKEAKQLVDLQQAKLPSTGNFPTIMADEAMDTIFDYFVSQADGNALYYGYSSFEKDISVYKDKQEAKEPLTIETDPTIEGGMRSGFFEELGYPLKPFTIIENGKLKNFTIGGKLSYLLKMPLTSSLSNIRVKPGKNSYDSFIENGVFELLRFSTFHPNPITGAFSGEIRLGYLHKNGQKIPIRGGSVSGISQEAFLKASLSREIISRESYNGPKGIFFESLTLAGE